MCWECDHAAAHPDADPGSTRLAYHDHLRSMIAMFGWAGHGIERSGDHPPWAHTVGLSPHGRPELVVTGMPIGQAACLLNDVASHVLHASAPRPGEQIPLRGGPVIEIVKVAEPTAHLNVAIEFYGPRVRGLQLVHADDHGHWPWDVGYRGIRGGQPVLGRRAAPRADRG
jgi:Domain of unknown function (DUF4262)